MKKNITIGLVIIAALALIAFILKNKDEQRKRLQLLLKNSVSVKYQV
jgi:hypothetical protein